MNAAASKGKVLVTGVDGYLGSLLVPLLIEDGWDVLGVDTGFYKNGWLYNGLAVTSETLNKDMRHLTVADFEGVDAVVAMAELSNDPVGDLVGPLTYGINHLGSQHVAKTAKAAGVNRFVYMSSCSVYGVADGTVDENSAVNPQTAYGKCKYMTENDLWEMADDNFHPVALRNATAFGASPRQRFDIVLNNLSGLAYTTGVIAMTSDGSPWRPMAHALDLAQGVLLSLNAPVEKIHSQFFNVGSNNNNYTVREIAETVANEFTGCKLSFGESDGDNRSYKVNFDKITDVLGFEAQWNLARGARQLHEVFDAIQLDTETFTGRGHTRLKQIDWLLKTGQVDENLFWKRPVL
jgi:nucleoside-diphosphate-sugar epimerase